MEILTIKFFWVQMKYFIVMTSPKQAKGSSAVSGNMFLESNASWIPRTYVGSSIPGTYIGSSIPGPRINIVCILGI